VESGFLNEKHSFNGFRVAQSKPLAALSSNRFYLRAFIAVSLSENAMAAPVRSAGRLCPWS